MSSEEKTLPPSEKKLSDAREKGQIAHFSDFVTAIVFAGMLLFIVIQVRAIASFLKGQIQNSIHALDQPFEDIATTAIASAFADSVGLIAPLLLIVIALTVLLNLVLNKGFLFATEAIMPKLSNLDPIGGFGRIFGIRALIEFLKSLFKLLVLGAILGILISFASGSLIYLPFCGLGCVQQALIWTIMAIMIASVVVFLVAGAADIPLQKWLFEKDMKMTQTEAKQERKDSDGNPEIKSAQRNLRMESSGASGGKLGIDQATLLIVGQSAAIGLRYDEDDTPVPMFVAKGTDDGAHYLLQAALDRGIAIHRNEELANRLHKGATLGTHIKKRDFSQVARAIHLSTLRRRGM
ncbi:EscU/YscU/HrcU family type III secretion system export apparatus switch protein [Pseudaestuariivita rosea]|uniref:EscU/YscU/HrcU family type III secretion system export apparatus switch protein n=1 Tax=Pseudaestuariivita rosea TaxID=2763263 RepID=UPI001ABAC5D1|nr:EscU/YscU/HrcU family type III secretion system export apparatus switch protein [Pseudaestuariivita rosea]